MSVKSKSGNNYPLPESHAKHSSEADVMKPMLYSV